jgi:hypothetical protein
MGIVTLLCSPFLAILFLANLRSRFFYHGPDYSFLGWMCLYAVVTGIGLRSRRKWAALLFALPCIVAGLFLAVGSVFKVPFPWLLINIAIGSLLVIAATGVLREWRQLRT